MQQTLSYRGISLTSVYMIGKLFEEWPQCWRRMESLITHSLPTKLAFPVQIPLKLSKKLPEVIYNTALQCISCSTSTILKGLWFIQVLHIPWPLIPIWCEYLELETDQIFVHQSMWSSQSLWTAVKTIHPIHCGIKQGSVLSHICFFRYSHRFSPSNWIAKCKYWHFHWMLWSCGWLVECCTIEVWPTFVSKLRL